jgi:recombination protein RecA
MSSDSLPAEAIPSWSLEALQGRLAELSCGAASAVLSLTFRLVLEAQLRGESVCWVTRRESCFFPPDAAASGVDLEALAVVRVPEVRLAPRAADTLVRSGGFGLVVLDLGSQNHSVGRSDVFAGGAAKVRGGQQLPLAVQTRLSGLAHKHHVALLFLTDKTSGSPSLGSLISLHVEAVRVEEAVAVKTTAEAAAAAVKTESAGVSGDGRRFECRVHVLKDKRQGMGWQHREAFRGPTGLC